MGPILMDADAVRGTPDARPEPARPTPGPWVAVESEAYHWEVEAEDGDCLVVDLDRRTDGNEGYKECTEPDARLIAKAPEMAAELAAVIR